MSRSFELEVKPLRGYGFKTEILKKAIDKTLVAFYQKYTDTKYIGTINQDWFRVSDCSDENCNTITAFFYCSLFLKEEAKFILKNLSVRIAELSPHAPFIGTLHMIDESAGYSWSFRSEYQNHLLSVRGVGMWDYADNPDTEYRPGICPSCGESLNHLKYHPDNKEYLCSKCKRPIPLEGIWWDCEYCWDLSHCGEEEDTILLCDINEHRSVVDLKIPEGITYIPFMAFSGCEKLETISLPSSLLIIDESAFDGCVSLKEIVFPSDLVFINQGAFSECASLQQVSLQNSNVFINSGAFSDCTALAHIELPNGIKTVDYLNRCSALEAIDIPGSVEEVPGWAFVGCESLKRVVLGEGVKSIGDEAFYGCGQLCELVLPSSLKEIAGFPFENSIRNRLIVHVEADSYAQKWAIENGIQRVEVTNGEKQNKSQLVFRGKTFITTGLDEGEEEAVKNSVLDRGGVFKPHFVKTIDCLVYNPNYDRETSKYKQAIALKNGGRDITIITYEDFASLVD